jgi:hypothetical protein
MKPQVRDFVDSGLSADARPSKAGYQCAMKGARSQVPFRCSCNTTEVLVNLGAR